MPPSLHAVLRGYVLQVVPEALYWYRIGPGRGGAMLGDSLGSTARARAQRQANLARSLRPYRAALGSWPEGRAVLQRAQSLARAPPPRCAVGRSRRRVRATAELSRVALTMARGGYLARPTPDSVSGTARHRRRRRQHGRHPTSTDPHVITIILIAESRQTLVRSHGSRDHDVTNLINIKEVMCKCAIYRIHRT